MKEADHVPCVLLVEDEPVSAAFMAESLRGLPANVEVAGDAAGALALVASLQSGLLLIDAHLPDARGVELLARLRSAGNAAPAIAHTASREQALHDDLRAAGFLDVLVKPLSKLALQQAVQRILGSRSDAIARPAWDDAAALATLGQAAHVASMRGLFLSELPAQAARLEDAHRAGDAPALRDELHRLTASCGFVGAARLGTAVRALQAAPLDAGAMAGVRAAVAELLSAP